MGQFEVVLSSFTTGKPHRRWYKLKPRPVSVSDGQPDLGAIRLKIRCTEQEVLPSACYEPLKQLLIDAVSQNKDSDMTFFSTLQEVMISDLNQMAYVLVKFYLGCDQVIAFLDCTCHQEINSCGKCFISLSVSIFTDRCQ
jgi:RAS protein activator-like 1